MPTNYFYFYSLFRAFSFLQILSSVQPREFCESLGANSEQSCENHIPTDVCIIVFGPNKSGQKRPELCESPYLQTEAIQCAKHCRICCQRDEHNCRDGRKVDGGKSCKNHRIDQSCWKEGGLAEMVRECAGTCGLCNRQKREWDEETMCRDAQWECGDMRGLCPLDERVRRICPKSCQMELRDKKVLSYLGDPCEEQKEFYEFQWAKPEEDADCWDTRSDCRNEMFFCDMPIYFHKLREECPRTCAHCKPPSHKCEDKNGQKCVEWQGAHKHRPFCQSHSFSKGVKFHWCPKTCQFC